MSSHSVLEWALVGAFLVSGIRQLFLFVASSGARGYPSLGIICLAGAAMAATAHWALVGLSTAIGLIFAVSGIWFVNAHARPNLGVHLGVVVALLLAAFAGGHLLLHGKEPTVGWLQSIALLGPVVVLEFWIFATTWRRRLEGANNIPLILLALTVVLASTAGMQVIWIPDALYLAALVPLRVAAMAIESREAVAGTAGGEGEHGSRHELSHSSRLSVVGELTASIAHEINQPLAAILSNADAGEILLENPDFQLEEIQRILSDIRRDGLRAGDVIRNVRTLAQKREPDLVKLDLNFVVETVGELLYQEVRRRRIEIAVTPFWKPAYVRGDQSLLIQALINLVLNSMDALEAAGAGREVGEPVPPVAIKVSATPYDEIEIKVVDRGTGIPKERLIQLFDSFYTSKSHGMGLGLSISRSIVSAHGGRIQATNNAGPGATFHIFLPPYADR